jgi:hypothetical protein
MNATGWSRGLDGTAGGTGVVPHAELVLLRQLADRAGLSSALPSPSGAAWRLEPPAGNRRQRSGLNAARISVANNSGSSHAAKWPPLPTSLK